MDLTVSVNPQTLKLMCVPFEIASFLQLEFLRGRFATTG